MESPLFFFKFVSFDRKDILENGLIRLTPAKDFNDPFELNPVITPISKKFLEHLSTLSESDLKEMKYTDKDYDYSTERHSNIENYRDKLKSEMEKVGILCLSSNDKINPFLTVSMPEKSDPRTNLLMWAHYADSHKGFIIEFERDFLYDISINKVNYKSDRDSLTYEHISDNNFNNIIFNKSNEWSYEQEYRAVSLLSNAEKSIKNIHLFKINKGKIRSITFGARMLGENKDAIIKIIKNDPEFRDVKLHHAYLSEATYTLEFYFDNGQLTNNQFYNGHSIPNQKKF